jgi:hypothetical protein
MPGKWLGTIPRELSNLGIFQASKAEAMSPRIDVQVLKNKSLVTMQINEDHL